MACNNRKVRKTNCHITDARQFRNKVSILRGNNIPSVFSTRTEETSASQYFQFYGYLSQQQNMMQDYVRTSTYQKAIHSNKSDFENKIVLDVGAGSGILSFFASEGKERLNLYESYVVTLVDLLIPAGAAKVYAVEASNMAEHAQKLIETNSRGSVITVIAGKIEEIELPEKVDIIISEPMGEFNIISSYQIYFSSFLMINESSTIMTLTTTAPKCIHN